MQVTFSHCGIDGDHLAAPHYSPGQYYSARQEGQREPKDAQVQPFVVVSPDNFGRYYRSKGNQIQINHVINALKLCLCVEL